MTGFDCITALKALGEETRLRMLRLLINNQFSVNEISEKLGVSQYNFSKHLRIMREAGHWNEAKDRLNDSALRRSVGQQQRLCLARTLAVDPEVILMDEPTSALDPKSTEAIEELILQLKQNRTVVLVTHNLARASRVADWLACIEVRDGTGELAECAGWLKDRYAEFRKTSTFGR